MRMDDTVTVRGASTAYAANTDYILPSINRPLYVRQCHKWGAEL